MDSVVDASTETVREPGRVLTIFFMVVLMQTAIKPAVMDDITKMTTNRLIIYQPTRFKFLY